MGISQHCNPSHIISMESTKSPIGNKAKNLLFLKEHGFNVPEFRILTLEHIEAIAKDPTLAEQIIHSVIRGFAPKLYAVRSSATNEDGDHSSNAGQYHTEIEVHPKDLVTSILHTIELSTQKLPPWASLALILQEYISPDISGVCFTRNPEGGREYVIEYTRGKGIDLVGGNIIPEQCRGYWQYILPTEFKEKAFADMFAEKRIILDLPTPAFLPKGYVASLEEATMNQIRGMQRTIFSCIEHFFGFPQDIEWCIRKWRLYILQSRPITTIIRAEYDHSLYLEKLLLEIDGDSLFEKTEVTEVAPRPTPFTHALLEKIYEKGGPIDRAYTRIWGIYRANNFFSLIGNELYIDRERELQTLLPAYSCMNPQHIPKWARWEGIISSLRNIWSLSRHRDQSIIELAIREALTRQPKSRDFRWAFWAFLLDYEYIFLTNLAAAQALGKLKKLIGKHQDILSDLLILGQGFETAAGDIMIPEWLIGNSLEVADESPFFHTLSSRLSSEQSQLLYARFPKWKQELLQKTLQETSRWMRLREYGRVLMVKNLTELRKRLLLIAVRSSLQNTRDIYFASLEEIFTISFLPIELATRKKDYEKWNAFTFPQKIERYYRETWAQSSLWISSWTTQGTLVDLDTITSTVRPRILLTDALTPELYEHFATIDGIISRSGGYLSHLSILARESGLPIVVLRNHQKLTLGAEYEIDGASGEVKEE